MGVIVGVMRAESRYGAGVVSGPSHDMEGGECEHAVTSAGQFRSHATFELSVPHFFDLICWHSMLQCQTASDMRHRWRM
jgi:hypothetical protein